MRLTKLHVMGSRWYAIVVDGNLTIGGMFGAPTAFPSSMPRSEVIAAMRRLTPELVVETPECP